MQKDLFVGRRLCRDLWLYVVAPRMGVLDLAHLAGVSRHMGTLFRRHSRLITWRHRAARARVHSLTTFVRKAAKENERALIERVMGNMDLGSDSLMLCTEYMMTGAVEGNYRDLIDYAIVKGAHSWNQALHHAAKRGNRNLIDFFISKGANNWHFALCGAAQKGHYDLVEFFLVKQQGEVDADSKDLDDPLLYAAWGGHRELVEFFLSKGASWPADVDPKTAFEMTRRRKIRYKKRKQNF